MVTNQAKFTFGFLGALTAVITGLAMFSDYQKPADRNPASQKSTSEKEQFEFQPYEYFID